MLDSFTTHGGSAPTGANVPPSGIKLLTVTALHKAVIITNSSSVDVFLALQSGTTCTAEPFKGIFLAARTGAFEIGNTNAYIGDIWAITAGNTGHVCIQEGK